MRSALEVLRVTSLSVLLGLLPTMATAQDQQPADPPPQAADPDVRVDPLQPDFNLAALPTTLRMPAGKWAFRVTHRFTRPLGQGNFGDLLRDAFGFDSGAQIGLELRYGVISGTQVVVHRTSDRTIQITGQQSIFSERRESRFGLDAVIGFDGDNNLREPRRSSLPACGFARQPWRAGLQEHRAMGCRVRGADLDQ